MPFDADRVRFPARQAVDPFVVTIVVLSDAHGRPGSARVEAPFGVHNATVSQAPDPDLIGEEPTWEDAEWQ
jgi:hypothetical protein